MTDEKLTDAQVAALAGGEYGCIFWPDHPGMEHSRGSTKVVAALALEVQSIRAKRCETCAYWCRRGPYAGVCLAQRDRLTTHDHSCADHTPK